MGKRVPKIKLEIVPAVAYSSCVRHLSAIVMTAGVFLISACTNPGDPTPVELETRVHIRAAWSPDGQTIAFTNVAPASAGVYVVDTSGANMSLVIQGGGIGLSWSPGSDRLVFSALSNLYTIKANGDSLTQLTSTAADIRPSWSPDGSSIVYMGTGGISLLRLSTGMITLVHAAGNFPHWTPEGTIFRVVENAFGPQQIAYTFEVIDTVGTILRVVAGFQSGSFCDFASMNRDSTAVVFSTRPIDFSRRSQIVKLTVANQVFTDLTTDGGDYPAWSPDGTKIVYTRTMEGDGGLWVMDADGSNKRRLTQP